MRITRNVSLYWKKRISDYVETVVISGANEDSVPVYIRSESKIIKFRLPYLAKLYQKEMYLCRLVWIEVIKFDG
jgi:hypothetical protein